MNSSKLLSLTMKVGRVAALASLLTASIAQAQVPPDAGALKRQLEQEQRKSLPDKSPSPFALPQPLKSIGGASVTVTTFRFSGNTKLSDKRLAESVSGFINKPLDFAGLQNAAVAVATAYRNAGWVVRVYLPEQDVTGGTVTIQIVEASFGEVRIEGESKHIANSRIKHVVENAQRPGTTVSADSLDRALLLLSDLPGLSATGRLSEGHNPTETDLIVTVDDASMVSGKVYADNAGARVTGAARIIGDASINSPFGFGDRISASLLHSEGSDYARGGYSLPVGNGGWRVGVNASHLGYDIVTDEFSALHAHGTSTTVGLDASYPLLRARRKNVFFEFNANSNHFNNKSAGITTTKYSTQEASVGLSGNLFDNLGGGGASNASVTYLQGKVNLDGSPNEALDALTTDTAGNFRKILVSAARQQAVTHRVSLYGSVSSQFANKNLDSSEKFYLGGASGVRAYPANEAGGAEGLLWSIEARASLPQRFTLVGFFDAGRIKINKDNDIIGAATVNTVSLKGVGVSVGWTASFGLSIKATAAHRMGSNPNPTITGTDQDGSLLKNRFWVQAALPF
jgi:hemolysin activation/secretion protein